MLSPGNDTRVNLLLLQRDRKGLRMDGLVYPKLGWEDLELGHTFLNWHVLRWTLIPDEAGGTGAYDGTICISLSAGTSDFVDALEENSRISDAERAVLANARKRLEATCSAGEARDGLTAWPDEVTSVPAREFLRYLKAADSFYASRWDEALRDFTGLMSATDPWVAEAAAYMVGRTQLNLVQAGAFDVYGDFVESAKPDPAALKRTDDAFAAYRARYPRGRYAASAAGLQRRLLWLGHDLRSLSRAYADELGRAEGVAALDLVQEIDNKLLFADGAEEVVEDPLLLATLDLLVLRRGDADDAIGRVAPANALSAGKLAAQAPHFAASPGLFEYLTASHAFYIGHDMPRVLALIPDDARQEGYGPLAFSRQMLRGMALAALKDRDEERFWRDLLDGADRLYQRPLVELALALNFERSNRVAAMFAPDSPILDTTIRERVLQYSASAPVLRVQAKAAGRPAHERDVALFTLLYKQLSRGSYAGFVADVARVPKEANTSAYLGDFQRGDIPVGLFSAGRWTGGNFGCPTLRETARRLAQDPRAIRARLCLGEFYRLNGFDRFETLDSYPDAEELGGAKHDFPGAPLSRGAIYTAIIADPKATAQERAYALYRAVNCYAPSGYNSCGGEDVKESVRRDWFLRLKREFPKSEWARKLRFYW